MKRKDLFLMLDLQVFGEGGEGGTAAEGATGVTEGAAVPQTGDTAPAAEEQTKATAAPDRSAEFEKLIKGDYKDLYDAKVQDTIQRRLKGTRETVERYEALQPTLDMLAKKYGVDAADIKALNKAIEDDDAFYEEEAMQKGITVQQLKEIRKMERENTELKRQMDEERRQKNAERLYASWMDQAKKAKTVYPSFDLDAEMQNPQFVNLLRSNVDVRSAYEVIHKDEIISGAMQFAVQNATQKVTNKVIANGARPAENGTNAQSATVVGRDVSQLSKEERADIIRRVARGEKIRF